MRTARQTPPGAKPNRDDRRSRQARFQAGRPGWLLEAVGDDRPRGMAATPEFARALQNPAYRPADPISCRTPRELARLSSVAPMACTRLPR
jgi:hypothetical protein